MKITNEWLRASLALGMLLACLIVAVSVFYMPRELEENGEIPPGMILLLSASLVILGLSAYLSEEPAWKTILKLSAYCSAMVFLWTGLLGVRGLLAYFIGEAAQYSASRSAIIAVSGIGATLLTGKFIKSKWLN